ncbi:hypothetical protein [Alloscardovia omnicolens]|uniref:hypothetical protein n=1 Tax=Alloscardovia omnicolens TaxID=419015 RepID=UPI000666427C|nr:hypothetical protein [Alloscardovia omnicolens]KWZ75753.1 hypothetical protein HMPREF3214_00310 [Alloscardovia omnicolens]MDK6327742.1 hypothetical protein [Alloscardovia omnicolens]MDK6643044.1 hypothetical protein [Alloscardovia omnicolens]MDK6663915.1 hypothetical protein [Alloscardovia omnicolens]MDK7748271.1 hypothetical protein [Alloscardovia omnicolens]
MTNKDVQTVIEAFKEARTEAGITKGDTKLAESTVAVAKDNDAIADVVKKVEASGHTATTGVIKVIKSLDEMKPCAGEPNDSNIKNEELSPYPLTVFIPDNPVAIKLAGNEESEPDNAYAWMFDLDNTFGMEDKYDNKRVVLSTQNFVVTHENSVMHPSIPRLYRGLQPIMGYKTDLEIVYYQAQPEENTTKIPSIPLPSGKFTSILEPYANDNPATFTSDGTTVSYFGPQSGDEYSATEDLERSTPLRHVYDLESHFDTGKKLLFYYPATNQYMFSSGDLGLFKQTK